MQVDVAIDDLAFVAADAVARPVNAHLQAPTPLIRRLEDAGGAALAAQLQITSPLDVGAAVVTSGGALEAPLLIHAVVMTDDEPVSRGGVMRATTSALQRAGDWRIEHLAMAPFGLGAGNLDIDESARTMIAALAEHRRRASHPARVTIIVENDYEAAAFRSACAQKWSAA